MVEDVRTGDFSALAALVLLAGSLFGTGCASGPSARSADWPTANVTPESLPDELDREAPTSTVRRGPEGRLYVVGGLPDGARAGQLVYARYSGRWPVEQLRRPPLLAGRLLRTWGGEAALLHPTYQMPDIDPTGLEVTWPESSTDESVGKGLTHLTSVTRSDSPPVAELGLGDETGVRGGDLYAVLRASDPDRVSSSLDLQLSNRFRGLCRVVPTEDEGTACELFPGGPSTESPASGDVAVFLEHRLDRKPRPAQVSVARVSGAEGSTATDLRNRVTSALTSYLDSRDPTPVTVETVDHTFDATRNDFYRAAEQMETTSGPRVVVGLEVNTVDGSDHLFVNYTTVGPAVGPGMVAAPPTGGVDLGPVRKIDGRELHPFAGVLWGALLVQRGENARAMLHLHRLLDDADLQGALRWHTRDQYAMRWGALGNFHEALWLVEQDQAIAANAGDGRARRNALGTRVRLYDFLERPDRAVAAAENFLDAYRAEEPDPQYLAALAMKAEMLAGAERTDEVPEIVERIAQLCPDGCRGDAFAHFGSIYWALPKEGNRELRRDLLDRLVRLGRTLGGTRLAAARLYQGTHFLADEQYEQALVAILEAARLYDKHGHKLGLARATYFELLANLGREASAQAFEAGQRSADLYRELHDVPGLARTYRRMTGLFSRRKIDRKMARYLGSAREVLGEGFELNWFMGKYGTAAESLLDLSTFLFKLGRGSNTEGLLDRAIRLGLQSGRFDVAALGHLYLALLARKNDDPERFKREIERAKIMGGLADNPAVERAIDRILDSDSDSRSPDLPTQTL